ncbi:hypothetical protein K402DRAFT_388690 [Aulographum hederae CBS 113979]|uniref:Secreted protein n=1 Tax=Aulographum hederae CBS 113979 TaxID=1176131 RepID=A0A6G1HFV8_9PEZI|nr:hypothetical protein K402DRAFT_388690 [Aulographum hederae CBS 113979]
MLTPRPAIPLSLLVVVLAAPRSFSASPLAPTSHPQPQPSPEHGATWYSYLDTGHAPVPGLEPPVSRARPSVGGR